jgi:hypothetical protein
MANGVDPRIPMEAGRGMFGAQAQQVDPFAPVRDFSEAMRSLGALQIQNQQIAARHGLSDIINSSPDMTTAAQRLAASGYSAWVPEIAEAYTRMGETAARTAQAYAATGRTYQEIGESAMQTIGKAAMALPGTDPNTWNRQMEAARRIALANTPIERRAIVNGMIDDFWEGVYGGTDGNPELVKKNILGLTARFGVHPDDLAPQLGGPITWEEGRPFLRPYGQPPGTITRAQIADPYGLQPPGAGPPVAGPEQAPQAGLPPVERTPLAAPPGAPPTVPPTGPLGTSPAAPPPPGSYVAPAGPPTLTPPTGPPALPPQTPLPGGAVAAPLPPPTAPTPAVPVAPAPPAPPTHDTTTRQAIPNATSDGRPLWTGTLTGKAIPGPVSFKQTTGEATYDPGVQRQIDARGEEFAKDDRSRFDSAQLVLGQAQQIREALNQLQRHGGWLAPGPGLQYRANLLKEINSLRQVVNLPPIAASDIAEFENFQKQSTTLGFTNLTQFFGRGREAMQTIERSMTAVPGIDNTFLGGQLVNRVIEGLAQRQIDEYNYIRDYGAANHGNMLGAEADFAATHPIRGLEDRILSEFGLGESGFVSPAAVMQAHTRGYLTDQQAQDQLAKFAGRPAGRT